MAPTLKKRVVEQNFQLPSKTKVFQLHHESLLCNFTFLNIYCTHFDTKYFNHRTKTFHKTQFEFAASVKGTCHTPSSQISVEAVKILIIPIAVADLGGRSGRLLRPEIFSISCSFSENLANSYVGAFPPPLPPRTVGAPSYGEFWIRPWIPSILFFSKKEG